MMVDCQEMLDAETLQPAVFLDRDGVLIQDVDLLVHPSQAQLTNGAVWAVKALKTAGYQVIVVSNQTVVARGLATEKDVAIVHDAVQHLLIAADGLPADAFYFCPHHPKATLAQYRVACQCRKPRPGLLLRAAAERGIDIAHSYMVGDRISDVVAGQRAGCKTILIESGKHVDPPIESPDPIDPSCHPDFVCADLVQAAMTILENHL
jgi:D-glycero-D-manno-heptose 1,7-bisphosphate phosphatase